jgi:dTMP kinase
VTDTARGLFIAFEGGEASGKSTQAARLAARLGAVLTREPGATELGAAVRELVLGRAGGGAVAPRTEALLLAADRAQHVTEIVEPALQSGRVVVTDRYVGSSLAYQGYGRGLDVDDVARLSEWATRGLDADVVVLLDVDPAVARARRSRHLDRIEAEDDAFHRRVVEGYRALAAADPGRWLVVDGSPGVDAVAASVAKAFEEWSAAR